MALAAQACSPHGPRGREGPWRPGGRVEQRGQDGESAGGSGMPYRCVIKTARRVLCDTGMFAVSAKCLTRGLRLPAGYLCCCPMRNPRSKTRAAEAALWRKAARQKATTRAGRASPRHRLRRCCARSAGARGDARPARVVAFCLAAFRHKAAFLSSQPCRRQRSGLQPGRPGGRVERHDQDGESAGGSVMPYRPAIKTARWVLCDTGMPAVRAKRRTRGLRLTAGDLCCCPMTASPKPKIQHPSG